MTLILLLVLSAVLSGSTDGELCAALRCCTSACRCTRTQPAPMTEQMTALTDVLYTWTRLEAVFGVLAGCSFVHTGALGSVQEEGGRRCSAFPSSSFCVGAADGRRGTLLLRGPPNPIPPPPPQPHRPTPKQEGLRCGLYPDCLSRFLRVWRGWGGLAACYHACRGDTCLCW